MAEDEGGEDTGGGATTMGEVGEAGEGEEEGERTGETVVVETREKTDHPEG